MICIAWKMTTSKQRKYALYPLNGLCLFGSYNIYVVIITIKKEFYKQIIRSTARWYFQGRQHGPAWTCTCPKN